MKQHIFYLLALVFSLGMASCDPENVLDNPTNTDSDTLDYVWDSSTVIKLNLSNTGITTSDAKKVTISGNTANITSKGTYEISGTLSDGQITVSADGIVRLILNNANITCSNSSPIFVKNAGKAIIILPENTENTLTDGSNYLVTADSLNATIYSKDYLAFYGSGKLTVNANYNGAISGRDKLIIESGNYIVNSVGFGIKGRDYLLINNGNLNITSSGDALKSDKDSVSNEEEKGFVKINNGTFTIATGSDGISATTYVEIMDGTFNMTTGGGSNVNPGTESTKGIKGKYVLLYGGSFNINSADNSIDADDFLSVSGGTFILNSGNKSIESDSIISISGGNITVQSAVKGVSSHTIQYNGGVTYINSTNDCFKATLGQDLTTDDGSYIEVNSGTLCLKTAKGDALDSNGSIQINGGNVVIQGSPTTPDDVVSYRNYFLINGGNLIGSGARTLYPGTTGSQNAIVIHFSSLIVPETPIHVEDTSGNIVATYKAANYSYYVILSFPTLETGKTYQIYTGGSASGTDQNGWLLNSTYTPGTLKGSFTINSKVTSVAI